MTSEEISDYQAEVRSLRSRKIGVDSNELTTLPNNTPFRAYDYTTGKFLATPSGCKTPKMLEVEVLIGSTLEEDYRIHYLSGRLGQKRLATRWGVARSLIFGSFRGKRRNWVSILGLPRKSLVGEKLAPKVPLASCEACDVSSLDSALQKAHWVEHKKGGSSHKDNIVQLCPNCHANLDIRKDPATINRARSSLLFRAVKDLYAKGGSKEAIEELVNRILHAR